MPFAGWPAEAIEFFEGLEADNSTSFWQANRDVYDRCVKDPMEDLLAELAPEFGGGKVFRPYRDMRFSKDKKPYKTNIAARVGPFGYVAMSSDGLTAGGGMVHLAPDQLERYRKAIDADDDGRALETVVAGIRQGGHECVAHDALKTAPKGYPKDHPRLEFLRAKGIIMWHEWPAAGWLGTSEAKDRIVGVLRASEPLTTWLADHVGKTTTEARHR